MINDESVPDTIRRIGTAWHDSTSKNHVISILIVGTELAFMMPQYKGGILCDLF
jgi:hypothetical protein